MKAGGAGNNGSLFAFEMNNPRDTQGNVIPKLSEKVDPMSICGTFFVLLFQFLFYLHAFLGDYLFSAGAGLCHRGLGKLEPLRIGCKVGDLAF